MDQAASKAARKTGRRSAHNSEKKDKFSSPRSALDWQIIWNFAYLANGESDDEPSRNATTYGGLKRMILSGQFGAGNKLVHEDLAAQLRVSRTPVREALERLYQEGFVTRLPRRGFYVAGITRDEAQDLYGTREALELFALQATFAHGPIPQSSIDRLSHYLQRYEELANAPQALTQRIVADVLFHLNLADLSGNRYLVSRLAQIFELLALKRRHEGYNYSRAKIGIGEHRRLIAALIAYDKKGALQILREHILSARDALLSHLYEPPSTKLA